MSSIKAKTSKPSQKRSREIENEEEPVEEQEQSEEEKVPVWLAGKGKKQVVKRVVKSKSRSADDEDSVKEAEEEEEVEDKEEKKGKVGSSLLKTVTMPNPPKFPIRNPPTDIEETKGRVWSLDTKATKAGGNTYVNMKMDGRSFPGPFKVLVRIPYPIRVYKEKGEKAGTPAQELKEVIKKIMDTGKQGGLRIAVEPADAIVQEPIEEMHHQLGKNLSTRH